MIRNLLNALSHDRSRTEHRSTNNDGDGSTDADGVDLGNLDFGDAFAPTSPATVQGQAALGTETGAVSGSAVAVLAAPGPTSLTVGSGSGIIFKDNFDSTCSQAYINCVVAAEEALRGQWTNSITLNLDFTAKAEGTNTFLATNNDSSTVNVTYAQLRKALQTADSASPDTHAQTAAVFLPTSSPSGTTNFSIPEAYARMLGLSSATPAVDATVTLNTSFNWSFQQDVINTMEHEISEGGMGRVGGLGDNSNGWSTMDLFRFDSTGALDTKDGRDGKTTFFSFNGGSTLSSLSFFNDFGVSGTKVSSDDTSDFTQKDVFGVGSTGETNTFSATDMDVMDVLGWVPSSPHVAPNVSASEVTVWENTSLNIADLEQTSNVSSDSITEYAFRDLGSNGHFTLNGAPVQDGLWVDIDAADLNAVRYAGGATPGTDTFQVTAFDATLQQWLRTATSTANTTVEPVVNVKDFAVEQGQSISVAPVISVANPSGDNITEYAFTDAGTNGHLTVNADVGTGSTAEPNSQWFVVSSFDLGDVQYDAGSAGGSDPIEVQAFDASALRWTPVTSATARTTPPILPPPGGGPTPSPVHALAVAGPTSDAATAVPLTGAPADTLIGFAGATLVGGPGSDAFVIGPSAGQETIQNFDPAHDTLQFSASLFASYAAAMTDARQLGTDTVFAIDARDSVTLQNVNIGTLTASNVHVG